MFIIDDIAVVAAGEVATEVVVEEAATEIVAETATEVASEAIQEAAAEVAAEAVPETAAEIVPETATEVGTEIVPETATEVETENTGEQIDNVATEGDSPRTIKTINDVYKGQNHPETGVPYVEKTVTTDTGEQVKGTFPVFESKTDVQLPNDIQQASDKTQFAECNKQLKEKVANDSEFRATFTEEQLADIEDGYTPEGYTWHHNEEPGKMQLVNSDIHSTTRHTGGRYIWGGGTENR